MNKEITGHELAKSPAPLPPSQKREGERDPDKAWCWACERFVPIEELTIGGRHDEDKGGCGCYLVEWLYYEH